MQVLFIPCTLDGLPKHTGSRLWRCEWVARHWPGAAVYDGTQRFTDYQLFVFQKAYLGQAAQSLIFRLARLRDAGKAIKLVFDLCDPDFLDDTHRERLLAVLPLFDCATATTMPLVDWLGAYLPAYHVPDGVDLAAVTVQREFVATDTPTLVWMGYQRNTGALQAIAPVMVELGVQGDIVAVDKPVPLENFLAQMIQYDILLNPRPEQSAHRYKSDNKTLLAWAAGVAVARDGAELARLLDNSDRYQHLEAGARYVSEWGAGNINNTLDAWWRVCQAEGWGCM